MNFQQIIQRPSAIFTLLLLISDQTILIGYLNRCLVTVRKITLSFFPLHNIYIYPSFGLKISLLISPLGYHFCFPKHIKRWYLHHTLFANKPRKSKEISLATDTLVLLPINHPYNLKLIMDIWIPICLIDCSKWGLNR